jgi:cysteine desulfurase
MTDGVELVCGERHMEKNKVLYDYFMERLAKYNIEHDVPMILNAEPSIPTFSLFNIKHINGEYIVNRLAGRGIYISTGSACSTGEPSYVLKNLYLTDDEANATIRVSLDGEENSKEDIEVFFREVGEVLNE